LARRSRTAAARNARAPALGLGLTGGAVRIRVIQILAGGREHFFDARRSGQAEPHVTTSGRASARRSATPGNAARSTTPGNAARCAAAAATTAAAPAAAAAPCGTPGARAGARGGAACSERERQPSQQQRRPDSTVRHLSSREILSDRQTRSTSGDRPDLRGQSTAIFARALGRSIRWITNHQRRAPQC
jgi:hypothetical protein